MNYLILRTYSQTSISHEHSMSVTEAEENIGGIIIYTGSLKTKSQYLVIISMVFD